MSRIGAGDVRTIAPTNNVYTVLAAVAALATILAVIVVLMRDRALFDAGLF